MKAELEKSIKDTEKMIKRLEDLHKKRTNIFDKRSENWQESDKGEKYGFLNNSISGFIEDLTQMKEDLNGVLDDHLDFDCPESKALDDFMLYGIVPEK